MELEVGQVWSINGLPSESELIIGKIESLGQISVASVTVTNVPVPHQSQQAHGGRKKITFSHFPFSEQALKKSLGSLLRTDGTVDDEFWEGYSYWKKAMEEGDAGAFDVSVAEAVGLSFETTANGSIAK